MPDTSIKLCDVVFPDPIIPASRTVGYGYDAVGIPDINKLSSIVLPGVTMKPDERETERIENYKTASVLETDYFTNPGVYRVQEERLPVLKERCDRKAFASVGGSTIEEYVKVAEILDRSDAVGFLELDSSCRNRDNSGIRFGQNATSLYKIINEVKYRVRKPVFAKLCPTVTNIRDMAQAAQDGGAEGIVIPGTRFGTDIDLTTKKPVFSCDCRYDSYELKPVVMRDVFEAFDAVGLIIVSCGGVNCAEDALKMIAAGASLVQIDEAVMLDPSVLGRISARLPEVMEKCGIEKIKDFVGAAHR